jgi:two-component sensor histidine kinase
VTTDEGAAYRTGPLPVVPSDSRTDPVATARVRGRLSGERKRHLEQLIAEWHLLADFCFSDLLLFVPVDDSAQRFVIVGQVRPSTSQTLYRSDMIGREVGDDDRPLVGRSFRLGEIIDGEHIAEPLREMVRVVCIPVRLDGQVIAVLSRETPPAVGRPPGELERFYAEIFNHFASMIAAGIYPFDEVDSGSDELPRVGDGVLLLDREARVAYASPNAVSALHRMGVHANAEGMRLGELGYDDEAVRMAYDIARPVTMEVEHRGDVTVLVHCIPFVGHDGVNGAVILSRDISELRRRDRLLLSKDATIREIHHRVKNNLQTVSALLRLQGRRLDGPEAKAAINGSVQRIKSIALVHDMLSRDAGEAVPFVDILKPLVRMVEDGLLAPEQQVTFSLEGDGGIVPAEVATPLAVVLNELLQNTVDHAFDAAGGKVVVRVHTREDRIDLEVQDDGRGLPKDFDFAASPGLGLSIVRALVVSDLGGTIDAAAPGGDASGTIVTLSVPLHTH